jgi:hypothetical protein
MRVLSILSFLLAVRADVPVVSTGEDVEVDGIVSDCTARSGTSEFGVLVPPNSKNEF